MASFEKGHARPDVNGLFVVTAEVVIETCQQQLLDARGTISLAQLAGVGRFSTQRLHADVIILPPLHASISGSLLYRSRVLRLATFFG